MQPSVLQVVNPSNYPSDFLSLKAYAVTLAAEQDRYPIGTIQHFQAQFSMRVVVYRLMKFQCEKGRDDDMIAFIRLFETSFPELIFTCSEFQHTLCGCGSVSPPTEEAISVVANKLNQLKNDNSISEVEDNDEKPPSAATSDTSDISDSLVFGDINMQDYEDPQHPIDLFIGDEPGDESSFEENNDDSGSDQSAYVVLTSVSSGNDAPPSVIKMQDPLLGSETINDPVPMVEARSEINWRSEKHPILHDKDYITEIAITRRGNQSPKFELWDEFRTPILSGDSIFTIQELEDCLAPLCYPKKQIWKIYFRLHELTKLQLPHNQMGILEEKHLQFLAMASVPVDRMLAKLMC